MKPLKRQTIVLRSVFAASLLWVAHGATCPPDPWDGFVQVEPQIPVVVGCVLIGVATFCYGMMRNRILAKQV